MKDINPPLLETRQILKATIAALVLGSVLFVTAVLPAKYGLNRWELVSYLDSAVFINLLHPLRLQLLKQMGRNLIHRLNLKNLDQAQMFLFHNGLSDCWQSIL